MNLVIGTTGVLAVMLVGYYFVILWKGDKS